MQPQQVTAIRRGWGRIIWQVISASSHWTNQHHSLIRARAMHLSSWGNRALRMRPSSISCRPRPANSPYLRTTHARWLDGPFFLRSSSYSSSSSTTLQLPSFHGNASGGAWALPDSAPCFYLKLFKKLPPEWLVPLLFTLWSLCEQNSQIAVSNRGSVPLAFRASLVYSYPSLSCLTLSSSSYTLVIRHPSSTTLIHSNCASHELLHGHRTSPTHAHRKQ